METHLPTHHDTLDRQAEKHLDDPALAASLYHHAAAVSAVVVRRVTPLLAFNVADHKFDFADPR